MSLLKAPIVKNSHVLAAIYFTFLIKIKHKTSFNSESGLQRKDQKRSYQVRENLAHFCNLVALILD